MTDTFHSLDKQIAEIEANLRLIDERRAQYVLETDVPLQLIREKDKAEEALRELRGRRARLQSIANPYLGLQYFDVDNAANYKGRDDMVERLLAKLKQTNLIALVGPSGCGKSSLVRAGLRPRLQDGAILGSQDWPVEFMRPGNQPLRALAVPLVLWSQPGLGLTDRMAEAQKLAQHLEAGTLDLGFVLSQVFRRAPGYLLVVDQFEETLTLCEDEPLRHAFVDALLTLADQPSMTVLLAVRADYAGHLLADSRLGPRADQGWVNVLSMTQEERKLAVEQPALMAGASFEEGLVDRIMDAVKDASGDLSALQVALESLWKRQTAAGVLTHEAYDDFGGVSGAIAQLADDTLARLGIEQKETLQEVFSRLVQPKKRDDDIEMLRVRAERDELPAETWPLVEQLARARLLVTDRDRATGKDTVEVMHEALIRGWPPLKDWVRTDFEFLIWRDSFLNQIKAWQQVQEDPGALLRGETLRVAKDWLALRPKRLNEGERDYIFHSLLHEDGDLSQTMVFFEPPEAALSFLDGYLASVQVGDQARGVAGLRWLLAPAVASPVNDRLQRLVLTDPTAAIRNQAAEALVQRGQTTQLVQLLETKLPAEERDRLVDSLAAVRNLPDLGPQIGHALPRRAFQVRLEGIPKLLTLYRAEQVRLESILNLLIRYRAEFAIVLGLAYLVGQSSWIVLAAIDDPLNRWLDVANQGQLVVPLQVFDIYVALGVYLAIYIRKRLVDGVRMAWRDWLLVALVGSLVSILFAVIAGFPVIRQIVSGQTSQSRWFNLSYLVIDQLGHFVLLFVMAWQLKPEVANRAAGRRSLRTTVMAMAAAVGLGLLLFLLVLLVDSSRPLSPFRLFGILVNSVLRWVNTGLIVFASLVGFQLGLRIAFPERFPSPGRDAIGQRRMIRRVLITAGIMGLILLGASQLNERGVRPSWLYCAITSPGDTSAVLRDQRDLLSGPGWDSTLVVSDPLPAGTCVAILGRDDNGKWLYVRQRGQSGWLPNDRGIELLIDGVELPIIEPDD